MTPFHPEANSAYLHSPGDDLVRLINKGTARDIAKTLANFNTELATWVESEISRAFGHDLKYTILRLRKHDRSAAAVALRDDDILTALDALHQLRQAVFVGTVHFAEQFIPPIGPRAKVG